MTKTPRTMRIDDELWEEVQKILKALRPRETFTQFIEKAAWDRVKLEKRQRGAK